MIDPEAKRTILQSKIPSSIDSHQVIVDLISETYINETINEIFFDGPKDIQQIFQVARLSLSSSILDNSSINGFLVGECEEILREIDRVEGETNISDFVRLSDIAVHYHISNYDANAARVAKDIAIYLDAAPQISAIKKNYYRAYSNFLQGVFIQKDIYSPSETSAEDEIFLFLTQCLFELIAFYDNGTPYKSGTYNKIIKLKEVLSQNNPYWTTTIELNHIKVFFDLAKDKALKPKLKELHVFPEEYIESVKFPFLWPSTKEFLDKYFAEDCRHAVVNTPTGSGKSFFAELAAASVISEGWVLYLAPTNALCAQMSKELGKNLRSLIDNSISVLFGHDEYSSMKFERKKIFVTTPEKALIFTKIFPEDFRNCELVILDECHILSDGRRGITSEIVLSMIMNINPGVRLLLMSALVKNAQDLSDWLQTVTKEKVGIVSCAWIPTRKARFMVSLDEESKTPYKTEGNYEINLTIHTDTESPWNTDTNTILEWVLPIKLRSKSYGKKIPFYNIAAKEIAQELCKKGYRTLIFVVRNKQDVFSIGNNWELENGNTFKASEFEKALMNICQFELGTTSQVCSLLKEKYIVVHSSAMLESEKQLSLSAFQRKNSPIQLFIATGTLSQGMNLDIDAVIVAGTSRESKGPIEKVEHEILNAMGRAARAKYSIHGLSFILPTTPLSEELTKPLLIERSTCIHKIDASTVVQSKFADYVDQFTQNEEINTEETAVLSLLPADFTSMENILLRSWGTYSLTSSKLKKIVDRAKQIHKIYEKNNYVPQWLYQSASVASLSPESGIQIYRALNRHKSPPKDDTYLSWTLMLIDLLSEISLPIVDNMLLEHNQTILGNPPFDKQKIIESMKQTIVQWIDGGTYSDIGKTSTREIVEDGHWKRTVSKKHILPVVFNWVKFIPSKLSRLASLLFAIQEKWIEYNDETIDEIPQWLKKSQVISTLSLGIKNGVRSPEALSCYESIISERLISNLLSEVLPKGLTTPEDIDARNNYAYHLKREISENKEKIPLGQNILADLRTYINNHA